MWFEPRIKTVQAKSPPNLNHFSHWQHLHTQYKDSVCYTLVALYYISCGLSQE